MVTKRKWAPTEMIENILGMNISPNEKLVKLKEEIDNLPIRNQPRPPAPDGGITYMAAERKYGINHGTIIRWVRQGYIGILTPTLNEVYIREKELVAVLEIYKKAPGRGRPTLRHLMKDNDGDGAK